MLIAIDGNEANTKEKVGVSTYAYELLWGLYRLNNKRKTSNNFLIYLKDDPCDSLPKENLNWKYKVIRGKKNWILTSLMPSLLRNPKADIFFTPFEIIFFILLAFYHFDLISPLSFCFAGFLTG